VRRTAFAAAPLLSLLGLLAAGCASGPIDYPRNYSEVITDTGDTRLAADVAQWQQRHPGSAGFYPLISGHDALGARLALIAAAERSIDAQYFLMKSDLAGVLFAGSLLDAADRGVRVRFLLDDVFTSVDDKALLLLDRHPNVEVRLFNPIGRGGFYYLNYVADFKRANRRMHNKSFTVDNQISIVGGRNIADEYFELMSGSEFRDFDMVAAGPVAGEIAKTFDRYWNHALAVPVEAFAFGKEQPDLEKVRREVAEELGDQARSAYARAVDSPLVQHLIDDRVDMFPAAFEVITDEPDKLVNSISAEQQTLVTRMAEIVSKAESEVIVLTPYFIPGEAGVEFWRALTARGVRVIILTNSLASNNHIPVHAGYARYRHDVIRAGVELYETRVDAVDAPTAKDDPRFESVTLHTKAVMIDRRLFFVGSLNLDPRSIDINSEMGVLVDSADMAAALAAPFLENLPERAYRLQEDDRGRLRWHGVIDGQEVIEKNEPQAGQWRRFKAFLSRILPESQL